MKALTFLSAVQTVGILVLIAKLFAMDSQAVTTTAASLAPPTHTPQRVELASSVPETEQLRAVIREEIATQVHDAAGQVNSVSVAQPKPRDPLEDRAREEQVVQRIETYKSVGAITDQQMEELQTELARLDQPTRRALMSRLVKAMNSGEIKGRF